MAPAPRLADLTASYDQQSRAHAFVQYATALSLAHEGSQPDAERIFRARWGPETESPSKHLHDVELLVKAAMAPGTTTDATWASPLKPTALQVAFTALVRPATVLGKLTGTRKVPFSTRITTQTAGTVGSWIKEGSPTPVQALAFATDTIPVTKLGAICVITKELANHSDPAAISTIERDLVAALAQAVDTALLDPTLTGATGSPPSLTNGAPTLVSTGSTAAQVEADLAALVALVNGGNLIVPYLVMKPSTARYLATLKNVAGAAAFPSMGATGGTVWGIPTVVSTSTGNQIVLIEASEVIVAEGAVEVSTSEQASLQMDSAPTDPVVAATVLVSLYQVDAVGIRAVQAISWKKARTASVAYISGVTY